MEEGTLYNALQHVRREGGCEEVWEDMVPQHHPAHRAPPGTSQHHPTPPGLLMVWASQTSSHPPSRRTCCTCRARKGTDPPNQNLSGGRLSSAKYWPILREVKAEGKAGRLVRGARHFGRCGGRRANTGKLRTALAFPRTLPVPAVPSLPGSPPAGASGCSCGTQTDVARLLPARRC